MPTTSRLTPIVLALAAALPCAADAPARPRNVRAGFEFVARSIDLPSGGAEIVAVSPNGKLGAVTQVAGRVQTFKLPKGKVSKKPVDVSAIGEPTSATFADDKTLLIVVKDDPNPGTLVVAKAKNGKITATVPIGIGPDSIAVDRSRKLAVVSIEDEETEVDDPTACPPENMRPGSIQIVDYSGGLTAEAIEVTTLAVDLSGLANAGCPDDPQPEFVAIDEAAGRAYVSVQENNAIAVVDLETKSIASIISAGETTHPAYTNPDAPPSIDGTITGRREPDGVAVSPDGKYFFTADEGDTGKTADGVYSGGRTMTVWDAATLEPVTDTGDAIERAVIDAGLIDASRADVKGPEPEGITVFEVDGVTLAAVGLERAQSVVFFDVTDPMAPAYAGIVKVGTRPEGVVWVPSLRLLLTGNETSGDVTAVDVRAVP